MTEVELTPICVNLIPIIDAHRPLSSAQRWSSAFEPRLTDNDEVFSRPKSPPPAAELHGVRPWQPCIDCGRLG